MTSLPSPLRLALALTACAAVAPAFAAPPDAALTRALQRDLRLDASEAAIYPQTERAAVARERAARKRLGATFAGSWLEIGADGRYRQVVASTTPGVRIDGAEMRVVPHSLARLDAAKARLDAVAGRGRLDPAIHSWYVDPRTNRIVVSAEAGQIRRVRSFATTAGVDPRLVRYEASQGRPQAFNTIVGGERYNLPSGFCSVGFPVFAGYSRGYVTAGHCGVVGTAARGANNVSQGVFRGSTYPGNDFAWVYLTNPAWALRPWVNNHAGGTVTVLGATPAPIGAAICRSGATTGFRCGTVTATNVSANYGHGPINGLVQSTACAGRGDSGGAFITPAGQAQGVTSGGALPFGANDNCGVATPTTFHQPLQPILDAYGLTLLTNAQYSVPPAIQYIQCGGTNGSYACSVSYQSFSPAGESWGAPFYSSGSCSAGQWVTITATVSNAFGSDVETIGFTCPVNGEEPM
jgi:hypothetical protein